MTTEFIRIALAGLLFQLTVVVGVGPQNLVLLRQGARRWGVGLVVTVCVLGDLILLPAGTAGIGVVVERMPVLLDILRWAGVAYLLWFAATCLHGVRHPRPIDATVAGDPPVPLTATGPANAPAPAPAPGSGPGSGGTTVATLPARSRSRAQVRRTGARMPALAALPTALAVTFLNPAAYVDGMVVFGSMANQYTDAGKWAFTVGAVAGSTLFFIVVGYGARYLARPLSRAVVWRWLNLGIAVVMVAMAARLAQAV